MKYDLFTEIGIGNDTFVNTEIEFEDGTEKRIPGFVKMKIKELYFRIWIGKVVFVLATNEVKLVKKSKNKFKFLFGLQGIPK